MNREECRLFALNITGENPGVAFEKYSDSFDKARLDRIERCKSDKEKEKLILTGALLSKVLQSENASSKNISYEKNGKPFIDGRDNLFFNISHSGDFILIGISGQELGVDIQKATAYRENLAKRVTSDGEWNSYGDLIKERFSFVWAVKEGLSKLSGEGISKDFSLITFSQKENDLVIFDDGKAVACGKSFFVSDGYEAVCVSKDVLTDISIEHISL